MLAFVRTLGRVAGTVVNLRSLLGYFCHLSAPAGSAFFLGKRLELGLPESGGWQDPAFPGDHYLGG